MRATAGATGAKPTQLAPKEIGGCSAPRWSGLGLVGKHSRTEHGQLTRGGPAYPRRRAERSTSGPPDGVLAKDRAPIIAPSDALRFNGGEDELIASTRGADEPVMSSAPVTRNVLSALEELKVVAQTGVG